MDRLKGRDIVLHAFTARVHAMNANMSSVRYVLRMSLENRVVPKRVALGSTVYGDLVPVEVQPPGCQLSRDGGPVFADMQRIDEEEQAFAQSLGDDQLEDARNLDGTDCCCYIWLHSMPISVARAIGGSHAIYISKDPRYCRYIWRDSQGDPRHDHDP